jgi:peptidyl-prolyl cis-trans isomerase C
MNRSHARLVPAALIALALLAPAAQAQNVAIVNGKPIPSAKVDEFMAALAAQGRPASPELRSAVRDELIAREVFLQAAEKKGLPRNDEVRKQLETTRQDILIRALIRDHLQKNPVGDDEVKAEYDRLAKDSAEQEFRARHILVETEVEAKSIIEQLGKGAKFEELAKKSKDPGSAQTGGDLDWNTADTFVPDFSAAMVKLQKGQFTPTPIKTQFGWHVIRLDDVRSMQPPPLEQVKPQIQQDLERKRIMKLQEDLRAKAKIQ